MVFFQEISSFLASLTVWQALAGGLLSLIALVLLMNRGNWWVLNVLAQDEPLLSAVGIFVFLGAGFLSSSTGVPVLWWQVIGAVVALSGVFIYRSEKYDISGLI